MWFDLLTPVILCISLVEIASSKVLDIPSLYGPIFSIGADTLDPSRYLKKRPGDFVHPGLWHSHDDLERIRTNVQAGKEPWKSAYDRFSTDKYSLSTYTMQGPKAYISRGIINNYTTFANDARAAYQNALMWYITKDQAHWDRSTTILDAWGSNLTDIIGVDRSLFIGLDGNLFVNAAEIMRWEGKWAEVGFSWKGSPGFSNQLYWLFSRQSVVIGQANYGMVSIQALLSFAVYLDDVALYNYAINEYLNNPCAGLPSQYEPTTGQSVESGRDQGHAMSAIAWAAYGARVAQTQGSDLYSLSDNILLKGAEYAAKYNLNYSVPYDPKWFRCEAILVGGPWANISDASRGVTSQNPVWDIVYYQYVVKRKLKAPWVTKAKETVIEGRADPIKNDHPGWGDLIWSY